ncbi:MAG: DUF3604 domain-containing protein [Pseudomonadota bacterium]
MKIRATITIISLCLLASCSEQPAEQPTADEPKETAAPEAATESATPAPTATTIESNPTRNAYFGDLHVHTTQSFDAFIMGAREDADAAYRFAKGEAIPHPSGRSMQLKAPLDFQMVSDHGVYLGMLPQMAKPETKVGQHPIAVGIREAKTPEERRDAFGKMVNLVVAEPEKDDLLDLSVVKSAWQKNIETAERHNEPGKFTTFIGYEYTTSGMEFENLHRNIVFAGSDVPEMPFSRLNSLNPEKMWDWLDGLRDKGIEGLAIPHNPNGSNGAMFSTNKWDGTPIDAAYAEQRMRNEPIVENTQVKGTSDTHPLLSPNDEWADFEIMPNRVASTLKSAPPGSYVRDAYLRGLTMQASISANPYKFGVVGSSDSHVSAGSFDEDNYWAKVGMLDATPQLRGSVPLDSEDENAEPKYAEGMNPTYGASGLAAVWAESNTRESIYAAFRRKETFSTSGPRIKVRFFGGYGLDANLPNAGNNIELAYQQGVPMGADLAAGEGSPNFFLWASRDANSAALQRLQVVKGWLEDGQQQEQVYDVACSDGLAVDPETNRCPDNGAAVNLSDCSVTADKGSVELATVWQDPDFDAAEHAFYYLRVLENPTCRWSTWDAIRAGVPPNPALHATIQERAWSSPIWYSPAE